MIKQADPNTSKMTLLGPHPSKCQCCAVDHRPEQPHNQQSLYWQYRFHGENGRRPTRADAIAHCDENVKAHRIKGLAEHGIIV